MFDRARSRNPAGGMPLEIEFGQFLRRILRGIEQGVKASKGNSIVFLSSQQRSLKVKYLDRDFIRRSWQLSFRLAPSASRSLQLRSEQCQRQENAMWWLHVSGAQLLRISLLIAFSFPWMISSNLSRRSGRLSFSPPRSRYQAYIFLVIQHLVFLFGNLPRQTRSPGFPLFDNKFRLGCGIGDRRSNQERKMDHLAKRVGKGDKTGFLFRFLQASRGTAK